MQRYFLTTPLAAAELILPVEMYKHAITVLRMKIGTTFEVVTPDEVIHCMKLVAIKNKQAIAVEVKNYKNNVELPVDATIICGLPKGDKADFIVQKGTELGAKHFIFFESDYSIAKWDKKKVAKKLTRLSKIAQGAAEQSHRLVIPTVEYLENLAQLTVPNATTCITAYEEEAKKGEASKFSKLVTNLKSKDKENIFAVFGPEGGISKQEIKILVDKGFIAVGLGPRIMRAETAPLYFLAALSFGLELA